MRGVKGLNHEKVCVRAGIGSCPVCHDVLGSELVMLPCGHQLCCKCSMTIIDRAPQSASPQVLSYLPLHRPVLCWMQSQMVLSGCSIFQLCQAHKPRCHCIVFSQVAVLHQVKQCAAKLSIVIMMVMLCCLGSCRDSKRLARVSTDSLHCQKQQETCCWSGMAVASCLTMCASALQRRECCCRARRSAAPRAGLAPRWQM